MFTKDETAVETNFYKPQPFHTELLTTNSNYSNYSSNRDKYTIISQLEPFRFWFRSNDLNGLSRLGDKLESRRSHENSLSL